MSYSNLKQHRTAPRLRRQAGLSLVELLVAITIGAILIFGATQVYVDSRNAYGVSENVARLQETARYALSIIEPDARMSNYWGLLKGANLIAGQAAQTAAKSSLVGLGTQCNNNFSVDLSTTLQGNNNTYSLGGACTAHGAGAVRSADTLTIRRVATTISSIPTTNKTALRVCSSRMGGTLVKDASGCAADPAGRVNDLVVHTYYVDRDSEPNKTGVPALRRWSLQATNEFKDDEIVSGIEDMQIQFGIDPTGTTGVATQYVNALGPTTLPATAQIVSVRIWLLVRGDTPEVGFKDNRTYEYGDRSKGTGIVSNLNPGSSAGKAYAPNDSYRRLLVSRTIMIRNSLGT